MFRNVAYSQHVAEYFYLTRVATASPRHDMQKDGKIISGADIPVC